jgi:tRNA pseudouridine55 synthase
MSEYLTTEDADDTEESRDYNGSMDGCFVIDKPAGMTSHDVIARVRKIIGERRVGHTGTLDPFATGVLVVLVGRATRLAQFLSGADKEYEAVIRLGFATDTGDVTGRRLETESRAKAQSLQSFSKEQIETATTSLRGEIEQTPPMYSAKKVEGRKLYDLARQGQEIERQPVRVTIQEFALLNSDEVFLKSSDDQTSELDVRVVCSAGTYVRTLAEDFGKRLGVGAHLAALRRTRAGEFRIKDALTLDRLRELVESESIAQALVSPDATVAHLAFKQLNADDARRTLHGIALQVVGAEAADWSNGQPVRLRDGEGRLIAVGTYDEKSGTVHPGVVIGST